MQHFEEEYRYFRQTHQPHALQVDMLSILKADIM